MESPEVTLARARQTFYASLIDGIGKSEAAKEYLSCYENIWRSDLYYDMPSDEKALLRLAKAEEDPYAGIDFPMPAQPAPVQQPLAYTPAEGDFVDDSMGFEETRAQDVFQQRADVVLEGQRKVTDEADEEMPGQAEWVQNVATPDHPFRPVETSHPAIVGRNWPGMSTTDDDTVPYNNIDLLHQMNPMHDPFTIEVGGQRFVVPYYLKNLVDFFTQPSEENPNKTIAEDHHDTLLAMVNEAKNHHLNPYSGNDYLGPVSATGTPFALYQRDLRRTKEEFQRMYPDASITDEQLKAMHMQRMIRRATLHDQQFVDSNGVPHQIGVGMMDWMMGLTLLNPLERTKVYEHQREHGFNSTDKHNRHIDLGDGTRISTGNLQANIISRGDAFFDFLGRDFDHFADNSEKFREHVPHSPDARPDHAHTSMGHNMAEDLRELIHHAAGVPLEEKYDIPIWSPKENKFIFKRRPIHNGEYAPLDVTNWTREGFLMAAGVNPNTLEFYESGEHPVWGEDWVRPRTMEDKLMGIPAPERDEFTIAHDIQKEGIDRVLKKMDNRKLNPFKEALARNSHNVLAGNHLSEDYFDEDSPLAGRKSGLKNHFSKIWDGHGGANLTKATIRDLLHDMLAYHEGEEAVPTSIKGPSGDKVFPSMFTLKDDTGGMVGFTDQSGIAFASLAPAGIELARDPKTNKLRNISIAPKTKKATIGESGQLTWENIYEELYPDLMFDIGPVDALNDHNRQLHAGKGIAGAKNPSMSSHSSATDNRLLREINAGLRTPEGTIHPRTPASLALSKVRGKDDNYLPPSRRAYGKFMNELPRSTNKRIRASFNMKRKAAERGLARAPLNAQDSTIMEPEQLPEELGVLGSLRQSEALGQIEAINNNIEDIIHDIHLAQEEGDEDGAHFLMETKKEMEAEKSKILRGIDVPKDARTEKRRTKEHHDAMVVRDIAAKLRQDYEDQHGPLFDPNNIPLSKARAFSLLRAAEVKANRMPKGSEYSTMGNSYAMDERPVSESRQAIHNYVKDHVQGNGIHLSPGMDRNDVMSKLGMETLDGVPLEMFQQGLLDLEDEYKGYARRVARAMDPQRVLELRQEREQIKEQYRAGKEREKKYKSDRRLANRIMHHISQVANINGLDKNTVFSAMNLGKILEGAPEETMEEDMGHLIREFNHDHVTRDSKAIRNLQDQLGLGWVHADSPDPERKTPLVGRQVTSKPQGEERDEIARYLKEQNLASYLISAPFGSKVDTTRHFDYMFGEVPVGGASGPDGHGVTSHFASRGLGAHFGHKYNTDLHVAVDTDGSHHFVRLPQSKSIAVPNWSKEDVSAVLPEILGMMGPHHEDLMDEQRRGAHTRIQRGGHSMNIRPIIQMSDGPTLLASLTNPDILYKSAEGMPFLQPMHRIFELDDLEHLRGFTGDWMVTAWPRGSRHFVERKGDDVKSWAAVKGEKSLLTDENKESLLKISKKDFLIDTVCVDDECHVLDLIEYDGKGVHDMSVIERMKILRGAMESHEKVLLPAAHNTRLTDDAGLEVAVDNLSKEHDRLLLRDANSTYIKGEHRHPKWVVLEKGSDVNLIVLDCKGKGPYTYQLGTGPITNFDEIGDRAVELNGEHYMDVGTVFSTDKKYEKGDIVQVNVDSVTQTEQSDGHKVYTINGGDITDDAEGEGISSAETLGMLSKSKDIWPHEITRKGERLNITFSVGDISYRTTPTDEGWAIHSPRADNDYLIRLSESQRPYWSPVVGVMLKAGLEMTEDESKAEVHESKGDAKPLIKPKKTKGTDFWGDKDYGRVLVKGFTLIEKLLKSGVGAVGHASSGTQGLGIDYATPIESPTGPTSLRDDSTMPDFDNRHRPGEDPEKEEEKPDDSASIEQGVMATPEGVLTVTQDSAKFKTH